MKKTKKSTKKEWFDFNKAMALLAIMAFFVVIKTFIIPETAEMSKTTKKELAEEAEIVLSMLTDNSAEVSLLSSNGIVEEKVENLDEMDYYEVKNILGVKNDFCIFFENWAGNLIKIDDLDPAMGSGKIYINGQPCK